MPKRKQSILQGLFDLSKLIPWWVSLTIAGASWLGFHLLAAEQPKPVPGAPALDTGYLIRSLIWAVSGAAQYFVPFIFVIGAATSFIRRSADRRLYQDTLKLGAVAPIQDLSWSEFERLVAEHYRRQGYAVNTGQGGADGGVDVRMTKGGETFLVQCKNWRAQKVGVDVVRQLYGVMAATGATGGFVVASGTFTDPAKEFCRGRNIELVNGADIVRAAKAKGVVSSTSSTPERAPAATPPRPAHLNTHLPPKLGPGSPCPRCGSPLVLRHVKKGPTQGTTFFGCTGYPRCKHTSPS